MNQSTSATADDASASGLTHTSTDWKARTARDGASSVSRSADDVPRSMSDAAISVTSSPPAVPLRPVRSSWCSGTVAME